MLTSEWKLEDALKIRAEEGEKRGRIKGEQEATHKIVNYMHKEGFRIADIVKATRLPEKDIKKILGVK